MQTSLDLSSIPFVNLLTLAVTVVIMVFVFRKLGITKLGPIEMEHESQATNAMVLKQLEDVDNQLHESVWIMTTQMMKQFNHQSELCFFGRRAIVEGILNPLQKRAASNHFTTHLTGNNLKRYEEQIMENVQDYYNEVCESSRWNECPNVSQLQPWEQVQPFYEDLIHRWILRVADHTKEACESKVRIYDFAIENVKGDKYWSKVFQDTKEKNLRYIEDLEKVR